MKKLFTAIRASDLEMVRQIIEKKPGLVNCVAKKPPKKDDGQSPLQVALKTGNTAIANYLLDMGADVNFIEDEPCANTWRAPVIHDAINRAIMYSRWNVNLPDGLEVENTKEEADAAFTILKKLISLGADVNAKDSYGNACIDRACLQARQILPIKGSNDRILTAELRSDISRIFDLLIGSGADMAYIAPNAWGKTYKEQYGNETVGEFLK